MYSYSSSSSNFVGGLEKTSCVTGLDLLGEFNSGLDAASRDDGMTSSNFRTTSGLDERVFPKIDSVPPLSVKISTEMECEDSSVRYFSTSSYIIDSLSEEVPSGNSKERVYSLAKRQNSTTSQTNCRLFEGHGSSPVWVTYDPKRPVSDQSSVEPTCSSKVASFRPSQRMATKRDACGHVVFNEDWGYIAGLDYRARDNSDIRAPKSIRK